MFRAFAFGRLSSNDCDAQLEQTNITTRAAIPGWYNHNVSPAIEETDNAISPGLEYGRHRCVVLN